MKEAKFDVTFNAIRQMGQNLYKNIYGILIEYITNSYDADASYVKIKIDRKKGSIIIEDDGTGMTLQELNDNFLKIGENRRKKYISTKTQKGRLVTGRKGLGKLAFFGLFYSFKIETFKDNYKSSLTVKCIQNAEGDSNLEVMIDDRPQAVEHPNGTIIYLSENTKEIIDNKNLAESIAKRLNLMYDNIPDDPDGFTIYLGENIINKSYRNELVLNHDIRFSYKIPEDIDRFTKDEEIINYIKDNEITGIIIAREKTVNIKENKGVILFARGKLCQEATYLNINPSNNYAYAHLYAEFNVDFIDNELEDNIGTDRTALSETKTTKKLFDIIEKLIKFYARLYDEDSKERTEKKLQNFKEQDIYLDMKKEIENIYNKVIREELFKLINIQLKSNSEEEINDKSFKSFRELIDSTIPIKILNSNRRSKNDFKDNITTSYDCLIQTLKDKYNYNQSDGNALFNQIYAEKSKFYKLSSDANNLSTDNQKNLVKLMREWGEAVVIARNIIYHTNDRKCINKNLSIENSKRFLAMIDLFLEMDNIFFSSINS
ncbi:ATP-binding protein [Helicobacter cappadocius]|uniref:ATP-binding protein n=1 Tax=Helicobacter cappadocius TaxID=3063998 RepID=A0AA90PSU5_9HELI|nr:MULTISPECIES: ATP-binding protein [unclassified Helicobacter]MDO7253060.1 ATP-binding protein [Helicobacter sp. faydin-H75]MDP2538814.1 ATP-binding protein [Helicobacter sp. faydin-H76]